MPPAGTRLPIELDVPTFSQRVQRPDIAGRICSPTSLAMVLAAYGVEPSAGEPSFVGRSFVEKVAERARDPRHDLYGNWPRNVQAAWSFGVPGYVTRFDDWNAVVRHFEAGRPVVASIGVEAGQLSGAPYASTAGHLIVLCGFDADGDVLVNDPAAEDAASVRRSYARSELDVVWLERGGTAYVLERPRVNGASGSVNDVSRPATDAP